MKPTVRARLNPVFLALALLFVPAPARAIPEPAVLSSVIPAPGKLTTAGLRRVDPNELNPHRRNWAVERKVGLKGLSARALADGRYTAQVGAIETEAAFHVRGEGPWYQPMPDFVCSGIKKHPWFSTEAGSAKAAEAAAQFWVDTLAREKLKLAQRLARVNAATGVQAMAKAAQVYQAWLEQAEAHWRQGVYDRARKAELAYYRQEAARLRIACQKAETLPEKIRERMEPVSDAPNRKFLVRAPSRRWNGAYSVRLSLEVGDKTLNGAFLIDSTAPRSIVSPTWLHDQGIPEAYVEVPDASVERAVHAGNPTGGIARRAGFDKVTMSGFALPVTEFLLYETSMFDVPETVAHCCAGILGNDFLRKFSVELDPGFPAAVQLYEPLDYSEGKDVLWEEVSFYGTNAIVSPCRATRKAAVEGGANELSCGGQPLASGLAISGKSSVLATAGNPVLAKGKVTLDLPNGRIWFSKKMRDAAITRNETGLELKFVLRKAARVLVVTKIRPKSPAARALGSAGLRPGMTIALVDGLDADELDAWQVERRLAGDYARTVSLGWSTPKGLKTASIELANASLISAPLPARSPSPAPGPSKDKAAPPSSPAVSGKPALKN
jgi:hypothetical protein